VLGVLKAARMLYAAVGWNALAGAGAAGLWGCLQGTGAAVAAAAAAGVVDGYVGGPGEVQMAALITMLMVGGAALLAACGCPCLRIVQAC